MTSAVPSALMLTAAILTAIAAAPSHLRAQDGPGFGNKTLHTSDVQYSFTRLPGAVPKVVGIW